MIAIDLSKQQALDSDPKAIQQINFTGNLNQGRNINVNTTTSFIIEKAEKNILDFSQEIVRLLQFYFFFSYNIKIK